MRRSEIFSVRSTHSPWTLGAASPGALAGINGRRERMARLFRTLSHSRDAIARIPDLWPREKRLGPRRGALPWLAIQAGDRRRKGSGGRTLPLGYHAAPWGRQRGEMAGIGAECRPGPRLALPIDLLLAVALAGG